VSELANEFKGEAGTIYIEQARPGDNHRYEVWFETFCILGEGDSELEALNDAWRHTGNIMALIAEARLKVAATAEAGKQPDTGTNDIS
jgi:hypothetical protein